MRQAGRGPVAKKAGADKGGKGRAAPLRKGSGKTSEPLPEEGAELLTMEAPAELESARLDPPRMLPWNRIAPAWAAPLNLPDDALPSRTPEASEAERKGKAQGDRRNHPTEAAAAQNKARGHAQRAYADLVGVAQRLQSRFVDDANRAAAEMARFHVLDAGRLVRAHDDAVEELDRGAERARGDLEAAAAGAEQHLESAYRNTLAEVRAAAGSAYGAIAANEKTAGDQVNAIVGGLVASHGKEFDDAIKAAGDAAATAVTNLQGWSANRDKAYSTGSGGYLERAKNEAKQKRVPKLAEDEIKQVNERKDNTLKSWTQTRESTVCGLECQYRPPLEKHRAEMHSKGRKSVDSALHRAKETLEKQFQEGRKTVREMRTSGLARIDSQHRAARDRLTAEARGTLEAGQKESRGALEQVRTAAEQSLPSYWSGVQALERALRQSGQKGAQAVEQVSAQSPSGIKSGLERTSVQLAVRLAANRLRLEGGLSRRGEATAAAHRSQVAEALQGILQGAGDDGTKLSRSVDSLVSSFSGLGKSVAQAGQGWSEPLAQHFAGYIKDRQKAAADSLEGVRTGKAPQPKGGGAEGQAKGKAKGPEKAAPDAAGKEAPAADCKCAKDAGGGKGGKAEAPGGGGGAPAKASEPKGLTGQLEDEKKFFESRSKPESFGPFKTILNQIGQTVSDDLDHRANAAASALDWSVGWGMVGVNKVGNPVGVLAALRGLTKFKGDALDWEVFPKTKAGSSLTAVLADRMRGGPDYDAAVAYLSGNAVAGAKLELKESLGIFNDDEARIEAVMRALSPDDLKKMGEDTGGKELLKEVHEALDGTDQKVFDALRQGNYAQADAFKARDKIDEARRKNDADALHKAIEDATRAPPPEEYGGQEISAEERRAAVVAELGRITSGADLTTDLKNMTPEQRQALEQKAEIYVTEDVTVVVGGGGDMPPETVTYKLENADKDLAVALLRKGEGSVDARVARLGVELQRKGEKPNPLNLDKALQDERFNPDKPGATEAEKAAAEDQRKAARAQRAEVLLRAAQKYGDGTKPAESGAAGKDDKPVSLDDPAVKAAQEKLIGRFEERYGKGTLGAELSKGLLTDERPSPATAAMAMRYGMYEHLGTNEELLFRFTERMTADEIAQMRVEFRKQTKSENPPDGLSLDAELGVYGKGGFFTELSGDDRLRMERALRGVARTDKEKLEAAAFAIHQQREETGWFGRELAEGSLSEKAMDAREKQLIEAAGGKLEFSQDGMVASGGNFDAAGNYKGPDPETFRTTVTNAQQVADNYVSRIDAYANVATTGLAVLGAIAAAVITVATGGAAGPLVVAALAAGLASMGANYAIKGGRYGWEQAAVDLGMTAVQAVTAGVGAQLGAAAQVASKGAAAASQASRMITSLARVFTGNPVVDQIIIGAITGGIGSLGGVALQEQTWEHGADKAAGALFEGLLKGVLSGAATAAVTQSMEKIGGLGQRLQGLAAEGGLAKSLGSAALRGVGRSAISATSGMAGHATEILFDAATGKYHGDAGDALAAIGEAGLHSAIQGFGEGAAESVGQRHHNRRIEAAAAEINRERLSKKLDPIQGNALDPHSPLHEAAQDLLFLNRYGRNGGDGLGRALNLDHVAIHGGMAPMIVVPHPDPGVAEVMHAELLRHVSPEKHGEFADVPIRVLPEAEYKALTRSESGPVVTLIEDGRPVVVVREGTPISRLADEGPHLVQSREARTRDRVARLDEAALAHWDSLDLDTQLDLYRNKIELEIDAHERILHSLESETPRTDADRARLAAELERADGTLRNLRARLDEVGHIGPEQRAAIAAGERTRPQYLDQPARLFSKDSPTRRGRGTAAEVEEPVGNALEAIESRTKPGRGTAEEAPPRPAEQPPEGHPQGDTRGRLFDRTSQEYEDQATRRERGNTFNTEEEARYRHNEIRLVASGGGGQPRVDSYVVGEAIISRKYTQLAEIGEDATIAHIVELADKYAPGTRIADVPSNQAVLAEGRARFGADGDKLHGRLELHVPEQFAPVPRAVLEAAERAGVVIRDPEGRIYNTRTPDGETGVIRASARDPDEHMAQMRDALLRHVPPGEHGAMADVPIIVLPKERYLALTRSESGPVVTLIQDGHPIVVVREGTPISRLADEGPHLAQTRDPRTRERIARLNEAVQANWDHLDLDTQIDLYRTKIELEIDAHERILRSLESREPTLETGRLAAEQRRAEGTLRNLRARLEEVDALGPAQRAAIEAGERERPQYLDQPARLFSKDSTERGSRPSTSGYKDQPDLRGPRLGGAAGSEESLRQRHEDWLEHVRRNLLDPGAKPQMSQAEIPPRQRQRWHDDIETAYAAYDALIREHGGTREAGIVRDALTGKYKAVLGSPFDVPLIKKADVLYPEPVLHYHPDYGPSLYRGPSGSDLLITRAIAGKLGRPHTEFIEFDVPGRGRSRTAFTVTPVEDSKAPGGRRAQIDIEFVNPATGKYVHHSFKSLAEWQAYYHSRTTMVDPDGPLYRHVLAAYGLSPAQIDAAAASHRPESAGTPTRSGLAKVVAEAETSTPGRHDPTANGIIDTGAKPSGRPPVTEAERAQGRENRQQRKQQERAEKQARIREQEAKRQKAEEQKQAVKRRQEMVKQETRARKQALREGRLSADEDLRQRLSTVARELNMSVEDLVRVTRHFTDELGGLGRRYDARDVIDSLRNRERGHRPPRYGDLEGVISKLVIEQNAIAVQHMREHIAATNPQAILGVERGGAFLIETLSRGMEGFPPTQAIPKYVKKQAGKPDQELRTPYLNQEIRRRIEENGESRFAIVDFYMGGKFANELRPMFARILRKYPHVEFDVLWMRETIGFEQVTFKPKLQDLDINQGGLGITIPLVAKVINGKKVYTKVDGGLILPPLNGLKANERRVRARQFPVDLVLGDDMRMVMERQSTGSMAIIDRDGRIVQEVPVGTRDPMTGKSLNAWDIVLRLMQGVKFDR
jgi:hypothetical protein